MKRLIIPVMLILTCFSPSFAQEDFEGSKDPVLFSRMPNHYISLYKDAQYDQFEFQVASDKVQRVEGHYYSIQYTLKENTPLVSGLQVTKNYANALKNIGGQVIYENHDGSLNQVTMKLVKKGMEVWAQVDCAGNGYYKLEIIEKGSMDQEVVSDASGMAKSIEETGKVALYGIYFDSGKADLKPESQPALEEISKMMKSDPALKLYVVGHTDNTGSFDSNIKLSMDRAAAVVNALVSKFSINAGNLKAFGNGSVAPVASNATEQGKALNRRVELVKQ